VPGIALVATDLDGTLLRRDITVSDRTVATLARARAHELPVVFVTGRPPRWMAPVAATTGHTGLAVGANGAIVLDLATGRVSESFPLAPEALEETVAILRAEVPGIGFAVEWVPDDGAEATHFAYEQAFLPRFPLDQAPEDGDVRDFARGRPVVKLLARVEDGGRDADALLDLAVSHVEHLVDVTHSNSSDVLLEMSAAGVSKGAALARIATDLGVAADRVAACGDMPNDVPMLAWAGVGLGVASAHPRVLAAADAVIPDPEHDGVAQVIDAVLDARA
jgi:Cof subfamily protein (haloacid dehalogenase superfamily)